MPGTEQAYKWSLKQVNSAAKPSHFKVCVSLDRENIQSQSWLIKWMMKLSISCPKKILLHSEIHPASKHSHGEVAAPTSEHIIQSFTFPELCTQSTTWLWEWHRWRQRNTFILTSLWVRPGMLSASVMLSCWASSGLLPGNTMFIDSYEVYKMRNAQCCRLAFISNTWYQSFLILSWYPNLLLNNYTLSLSYFLMVVVVLGENINSLTLLPSRGGV